MPKTKIWIVNDFHVGGAIFNFAEMSFNVIGNNITGAVCRIDLKSKSETQKRRRFGKREIAKPC